MKNTLQDKTNKEIIQYLFDKNWYDDLWVDFDIIKHINWEKKQSYHDFCIDMGVDVLDYILYNQSIDDFNVERWCDLVTEWADWKVNMRYADLYRSVPAFCDFINDAISEWLVDMKNFELWRAIEAWQYEFYYKFWMEVLNQIENELNRTEDEELKSQFIN